MLTLKNTYAIFHRNPKFCKRKFYTRAPQTLVIALGGNALLRKGDNLDQATQMHNIEKAAKAIAKIAQDKKQWRIVVTHGNGPQVGFLALKQEKEFGLDVLTAETQGMIGAQMQEVLENYLPGREVATMLTQVEVDGNDPSFKNPTKPVGPFYKEPQKNLGTMVKVKDNPPEYRRVVASPAPKSIIGVKTLRSLVSLGVVLICAGGGGIPIVNQGGLLHAVSAVIDKDLTAALLAKSIGANGLVMLTDVEAVYRNISDLNSRIERLDVDNVDQAWLKKLPAGSIGPKVTAGIDFVKATGGWAAIGSLDNALDVIDGKSGTIIHQKSNTKIIDFTLPEDHHKWNQTHVKHWLTNELRLGKKDSEIVAQKLNTGDKLFSATADKLASTGITRMMANHLIHEIRNLQQLSADHVPPIVVEAAPYSWPCDRIITTDNTALVIIDMQKDFCQEGGYFHSMGYSVQPARKIVPVIKRVLDKMRKLGFPVFHTREGHEPNMSDCPPTKYWRSLNLSEVGIGSRGPLGRVLIQGEDGWNIIPELEPQPKEVVIDKCGKGTFHATSFDAMLRNLNIRNLILCGVTTDVCVHTTMREANDRGYDCLLLTDATAAADDDVHWAAVKSVQLSGGIFGATTDSESLVEALNKMEAAEDSNNK